LWKEAASGEYIADESKLGYPKELQVSYNDEWEVMREILSAMRHTISINFAF